MTSTSEKKPLLLLVEDDPSTQAALVRLLRPHYNLLNCDDAEKALSILDPRQPPDVILSDYSLPKKSGMEFLKQAKEICPESIRVLLTGHVVSDEFSLALKSGTLHRIFLKPWENSLLLLQIQESLLQGQQLRRSKDFELKSWTDGLTGLFNQKYFKDSLVKEVERSLRHQRPVSLVLIDVDQFKSVNDTMGHALGDQALILVSQVLRSTLRNIDLMARIGGDEFAAILPDTGATAAKEIAERLRSRVLQQAKTDYPQITVSLGVAEFVCTETIQEPTGQMASEIANSFFAETDKALYQAKSSGKNQTKVAVFNGRPVK